MRSYHLLVSGRVQGVGYRFFVRQTACELGVNGWVRNLHDGRVEVLAQCNEQVFQEFHRRLLRGPLFAKVENLEIATREAPACSEFSVHL